MRRTPIIPLLLLLFSSTGLMAQLLKVDLEVRQLCEDTLTSGIVEIDILLSASEQSSRDFSIGSSTLLINYSAGEINFSDYAPANFDVDSSSLSLSTNWQGQKFEYLDEFGIFHLVLQQEEILVNPYIFQIGQNPVKVGTLTLENLTFDTDYQVSIHSQFSIFNDGDSPDGANKIAFEEPSSLILNASANCPDEFPDPTGDPTSGSCDTPVNLALNQVTSQSTTRGDGLASFAVDGNLIGDDNWGADANLQHTETLSYSWWKVDLGDLYKLDTLVIFNRSSTAPYILNRLRDFYIFTSESDINGEFTLNELENDPNITPVFFAGGAGNTERISLEGVIGRYVMIKLSGNGPLHMAEVEVYGCEPYTCDVVLTSATPTPTSTCGGLDGSLGIVATGSNLEYSIDGGVNYQASPDFSSLAAGSYEVRVRDVLNPQCEVSYAGNPVSVSDPSESMEIQWVTRTNVSDCGTTDGTLSISASGNSLEYSIDGGQTYYPSPDFTDLDSGNYVIVIRENSGSNCSLIYENNPLRIDRPSSPEIVEISPTDISDCGLADGQISINATGDNLEYSINGGGSFQADPNFIGLASGSYQVMVQTSGYASCTTSAAELIDISSPIAPDVQSIESTNLTDCGLMDGSITITASGDSLEYSIDGGLSFQEEALFAGLDSGSYEVLVREVNHPGCSISYTDNPVVISSPELPTISELISSNASDCGVNDGSIQIIAEGINLEYSIDGGANYSSSSLFENLGTGFYEVSIREQANTGCEVSGANPVEISNPSSLVIDSVDFTPVWSDCEAQDGTIEIFATGNSLEYSIDGGLNYQEDSSFIGLDSGNYEIFVREIAQPNCIQIYSGNPVRINAPLVPIIDLVTTTDLSDCGVLDGTLTINAQGSNLEYSLDGGQSYQSDALFSGLDSGNYIIIIREVGQANCIQSYGDNPVRINAPLYPTIDQVSSSNLSDCGVADGTISISAQGSNLEYSIDQGISYQATPIFSELNAGSYEVRIREMGFTGCWMAYEGNPIILSSPSLPQIQQVNPTNLSDCDLQDGQIEVLATGTNLEYSLDGVSYQSQTTFSGLAEGEYTVYVRENGFPQCESTMSISLSAPANCGECISANLALGGIASQSTTRGDGVASFAIDGNLIGNDNWGPDANMQHTNTITNSWWKVDLGVEASLDSLVIYNRTTTSNSLLRRLRDFYVYVSTADIDGGQSVTTLNSSPSLTSYFFSGDAGQKERILLNQVQGRYVLIKLPSKGPIHLAEVEVFGCDGPPPPCDVALIDVQSQNESDCSASDGSIFIQATGSNLEYSIDGGSSYSSSATISNLSPGNYLINVRNALQPSCEITWENNPLVITGPSLPSLTQISVTDLSDCETSDGSIQITASGTSVEYSLDGNSYQIDSVFSNLAEGSYPVYVRESANPSCEVSGNGMVSKPEGCEPEGCSELENLALNGSASQSSTHGDGIASHAIDGNLEGDDNWGADANLQHTKTLSDSWWKVDLGQLSSLDSIEIINRTSTSAFLLGRLKEFYVLISPVDFDAGASIPSLTSDPNIHSVYYPEKAGNSVSFSMDQVAGRYVAIRLSGNGPLHISEVEVWGCSHNSSGASSRFSSATNAIEGVSSLQLLARPNPFTGTFTLEVLGSFEGEAELQWVNALGQILGKAQLKEGESLNLGENLAAGIFFVHLKLGEEAYQVMVVKTQE